ncbi:hypothetical protein [Kineococcus rhizosphaerae]|uniref:DUF3040 family protein n=1 Tax=Kineococcus rhizosphaerae TaxID=559628 RepID=A0A2T0R2F1_9ACTN|nr:hypothetical protein [Kineococcus rhizosphaerae]PRY13979.1 hypothetical protein CLV37_10797 [Kineococcus rhizosphaerae]
MSAVVGPEMTPQRRATALRAFHTLPKEDREDVLALARQGRRHPDERVAAVAWWYAAAVLQPRWYNRMPLAVPVVAVLALLAAAFLLNFWPLGFLAIVVLLVSAALVRQRLLTGPLLGLMRPPAAGDVPD